MEIISKFNFCLSFFARSLSEMGYILLGRKSIFIINVIILIGSTQVMIIYFIIIGDICASYITYFTNVEEGTVFYTSRGFYAFLSSIPISFFIFKKEMHELKIASFMLFSSILLFVLVFII